MISLLAFHALPQSNLSARRSDKSLSCLCRKLDHQIETWVTSILFCNCPSVGTNYFSCHRKATFCHELYIFHQFTFFFIIKNPPWPSRAQLLPWLYFPRAFWAHYTLYAWDTFISLFWTTVIAWVVLVTFQAYVSCMRAPWLLPSSHDRVNTYWKQSGKCQ